MDIDQVSTIVVENIALKCKLNYFKESGSENVGRRGSKPEENVVRCDVGIESEKRLIETVH